MQYQNSGRAIGTIPHILLLLDSFLKWRECQYSPRKQLHYAIFSRRHTIMTDQKLGSSGLEVIFFFMLKSAEHEIFSANKYENANFSCIFIFISGESFMLSCV